MNDRPIAFAKGTLTAPNHKPIELKSVYILVQTNGLDDGSAAD